MSARIKYHANCNSRNASGPRHPKLRMIVYSKVVDNAATGEGYGGASAVTARKRLREGQGEIRREDLVGAWERSWGSVRKNIVSLAPTEPGHCGASAGAPERYDDMVCRKHSRQIAITSTRRHPTIPSASRTLSTHHWLIGINFSVHYPHWHQVLWPLSPLID